MPKWTIPFRIMECVQKGIEFEYSVRDPIGSAHINHVPSFAPNLANILFACRSLPACFQWIPRTDHHNLNTGYPSTLHKYIWIGDIVIVFGRSSFIGCGWVDVGTTDTFRELRNWLGQCNPKSIPSGTSSKRMKRRDWIFVGYYFVRINLVLWMLS